MDFIRKRFSSSDLVGEATEDKPSTSSAQRQQPTHTEAHGTSNQTSANSSTKRFSFTSDSPQQQSVGSSNPFSFKTSFMQSSVISGFRASAASAASNVATSFPSKSTPGKKPNGPSPSAPVSPTHRETMVFPTVATTNVHADTGIQGFGKDLMARAGRVFSGTTTDENSKFLLIIDNNSVDWSKYFRARKIMTPSKEWDIRMEQADFSEITLSSSSTGFTTINITKDNGRIVKNFKPNFVLIRQRVRDADRDWRHLLVGLRYTGLIRGVNTIHAAYNFCDKPWVYSQLLQIRNREGFDHFPLIDQTILINNSQELPGYMKFPMVLKIGHTSGGRGKIKVENAADLRDILDSLDLQKIYCTVEPFIDSKFDILLQKIGVNYKAYMRKSITGEWKTNRGSSVLEQINITDRYRHWLDKCAMLFGGLDIIAIQAVQRRDGIEFIIDISDSTFTLIGDTQEDDRRQISNLVAQRMQEGLTQRLPHQMSLNKNLTGGSSASMKAGQQPTGKQPISMPSSPHHSQYSMDGPVTGGEHRFTASVATTGTGGQVPKTQNPPYQRAETVTGSMPSKEKVGPKTSTPMGVQRPNTGQQPPIPPVAGRRTSNPTANISSAIGSSSIASRPPATTNTSAPPTTSTNVTQQNPHRPPPVHATGQMHSTPPKSAGSTPLARQADPSLMSRSTTSAKPATEKTRKPSNPATAAMEDAEDTMKNLRKTFTGIFGDM